MQEIISKSCTDINGTAPGILKLPGILKPTGLNIKLPKRMVFCRSCPISEVVQTHITRMMFPQGEQDTAGTEPQLLRGSLPGSGWVLTGMENTPNPQNSVCLYKQQRKLPVRPQREGWMKPQWGNYKINDLLLTKTSLVFICTLTEPGAAISSTHTEEGRGAEAGGHFWGAANTFEGS